MSSRVASPYRAWRAVLVIALLVPAVMVWRLSRTHAAEKDKPMMLLHDVYFELNDASPEAQAKLVAACRKYLTGHPGTVFFAAGTLAADLARPVNDRSWHVSLHILFEDQASHDRYQVAPRHDSFIAECKDNWKNVRVFDTLVESGNVQQ